MADKLRAIGITCGIGSMLVGARQAGFDVVGQVEWRKYYHAKDDLGRNTFRDNFNGVVFKEKIEDLTPQEIERMMDPDLALGHPECLPGVSKVYTSKGWKKLRDVKVGDLVLTHKGRFRPVVRTVIKDFYGRMVALQTKAGPGEDGTLWITPDHPVRIGDRWIKAGDVKKGDRLKVLGVKCQRCENLMPVFADSMKNRRKSPGRFCSVSCAVRDQWGKANSEERRALVRKAHRVTRSNVKKRQHPFFDRLVRVKQSKNQIYERRASEILIERGIEFEYQWPVDGTGHRYFIDFAVPNLKVGLEIEEPSHRVKVGLDEERIQDLGKMGWTIVRARAPFVKGDSWKNWWQDISSAVDEMSRLVHNHAGDYKFIDVPVKKIKLMPKRQQPKVYNLSVLDDNSYVTKGFVVKNCGNFSQLAGANKNRLELLNDAADIPLFCDLVAKLRPSFFVMDDLPRSFGAFPMSEYVRRLPDYDLFPEWVSNWGYGNVQRHRNRMFMIGALKKHRWAFVPGETEQPDLTLESVIGDLPDPDDPPPGSNVPPNHYPTALDEKSGRSLSMRFIGDRPTWREVAEYAGVNWRRGKSVSYFANDGTVKYKPGSKVEFWEERDRGASVQCGASYKFHSLRFTPLTIRERARIQGFPDDFVFYGAKLNDAGEYNYDRNVHMTKQTGKAMPIQFCRYVSRQVAAHLRGEPFESSNRRILNNNAYVDAAKKWYCETVGYSDQRRACSACWLYDRCTIRSRKYRIGEPAVGQLDIVDPGVVPGPDPVLVPVPVAEPAHHGGDAGDSGAQPGRARRPRRRPATVTVGEVSTERGDLDGPGTASPEASTGPRRARSRSGDIDRSQRRASAARSARFADLPREDEYDVFEEEERR